MENERRPSLMGFQAKKLALQLIDAGVGMEEPICSKKSSGANTVPLMECCVLCAASYAPNSPDGRSGGEPPKEFSNMS